MYNGIKVDGVLYKARYSKSQDAIAIYADSYQSFPAIDGLTILNDTDSMIDYFEKDTIRVNSNNPHYIDVKDAYNMQCEHDRKWSIKRVQKSIAKLEAMLKERKSRTLEEWLAQNRSRLAELLAA